MGEALQAAERFYESFGAGDFARATECFSADCITVTPAGSMNPTEHEEFGRAFKRALPDAHMEVVKVVEAGPELFVEGRFKGTQKADLVTPQGVMPAHGNQLNLPYADYFRVKAGKIVEHHVFWDQAAIMAQLGAGQRSA